MEFRILLCASLAAAMFTTPSMGADTAKKTTAPAVRNYSTTKRVPVKISKSTTRVPAQTSAGTKAKPSVRANAYYAPRQSGPTPDRYKQIQESLISRGYLEGPATGVWDQNSIEAMKKFQEQEKLEPTGKVTAKALIDLGLGPRDESISSTTTLTNK